MRDNALEYVEHLSWLLFIKFLDEDPAGQLRSILEPRHQWGAWASPLTADAAWEADRPAAAARLDAFVREDLLPALAALDGSPERRLVGDLFRGRNVAVCASPANLRDVVRLVDQIPFRSADDIYVLSQVYEDLLRRLGTENTVAGEFYTPRPVVRFLIRVLNRSRASPFTTRRQAPGAFWLRQPSTCVRPAARRPSRPHASSVMRRSPWPPCWA